jgi:hypothetical protein
MNLRKVICCLVAAAFMTVPLSGEQHKGNAYDSVFLNDGRVISGIILEDSPGNTPESYLNSYVKIQSGPNQIRVIYYRTIKVVRYGTKPAGAMQSIGER